MHYLLAALVTLASFTPAAAQGEVGAERASPTPELAFDEIFVRINNNYDVTLSTMGLAGVHRIGRDSASGILSLDEYGNTYRGTLTARAKGTMDARSLLGNCSDASNATQQIYAVAYIERPGTAFLPTDSLGSGSDGDFDLNFFFFPETAPIFEGGTPRCQGVVGFDGYGPLFGSGGEYNEAPYPWLPQTRPPGEFIPFNDSRWSSQNGLLLHAPPAGETIIYLERSQVFPEQQVDSRWVVKIARGDG